MDTLRNSHTSDNICYFIKKYINLFNAFDNVYLFGSILNKKEPSDIDILLIYSAYSSGILTHINTIYTAFESLTELPLDLTVLSVNEEQDTRFLEKLNSKFIKLK